MAKIARYYLSAIDFAYALIKIVTKKNKGIFNVGSNFYEKNINIAKLICKFLTKILTKTYTIYQG